MPPHVGPLDRLIRIVPGALVVLALSGKIPVGLIWCYCLCLCLCLCRRVLPASARSSSIGR